MIESVDSPSCDFIRAWVYPKNPRENGYFIYPDVEEDGMVDDFGFPTAKALGKFYYDVNTQIKNGHEVSLSRWTRFQATPPNWLNNDAQNVYDGDIVKIKWLEGLREISIWYSVNYRGNGEGRWVLDELGDHANREYIPIAEIMDLNRELKAIAVVGHRWKKITKKD